jgi:hypothetical protein
VAATSPLVRLRISPLRVPESQATAMAVASRLWFVASIIDNTCSSQWSMSPGFGAGS